MPVNNFLTAVMQERREDAQRASRAIPLTTLKQKLAVGKVGRSLKDAWQRQKTTAGGPCIIAEVKKASPSAGLLCRDYHPETLALEYEKAGAVAISVLTEPRHFMGSDDDLRRVRQTVGLPVLRKDFICEPYQIYESAVLGADIVLLIAAALGTRALRALVDLAVDIGLEALVEVHTLEECKQAMLLEKAIVGVNSRDLVTLKTDLAIARRLAPYLPKDRLSIAESGIHNRRELEALQAVGYQGFLIGEALMKSADAGKALRSFLVPAGS